MKPSTNAFSFQKSDLNAAAGTLSGLGLLLYQNIQLSISSETGMPTVSDLAERYELSNQGLKNRIEKQLQLMVDELKFLSDFTITHDGKILVHISQGFSMNQVDQVSSKLN